jgi:uncharacterized protein YukJ
VIPYVITVNSSDKWYYRLKITFKHMKKEIKDLNNKLNFIQELVISLLEQQEEEWLDSTDIKQRFHFSESKLYRLRTAKAIPFTKIGNRYYYPKTYFNRLLLQQIQEDK